MTPDSLPTLPPNPDPIALLLQDKRSPATQRAYRADLKDFFGGNPDPDAVETFLRQGAAQVALALAAYKARLMERGLTEATVNRRLAAVRSLLRFSHRLGLAQTDGRGLVDSEKAQAYRDTRGVDAATMRRLLALPDQTTLLGRRDAALLRLLCENALRRAEACALDVADFDPAGRRLSILGKGKGTQKVPVTLSLKCAETITAYLGAGGHQDGPLFRSGDHRTARLGARLAPNGLYKIVRTYGRELGLALAPHKLRHSAITAALDATGGDLRRVQRLSRHADLRTLTIYDDNRTDFQGEVTDILSGLL